MSGITQRRRGAGLASILVSLLVVHVGCSAGISESAARRQQVSRLRSVISIYISASRALGRPPRDESEFKEFIAKQGGKVFESAGVNSADELLVSERDGKPFIVLYKKPTSKNASSVIAYEAEGVDGIRDVGYDLGNINQLNETQFAELGL